MKKVTILLLLLAYGCLGAQASVDWKEVTSIEHLCNTYPERVSQLFDELDLNQPDLAAVKAAVDAKRWEAACDSLLKYYLDVGQQSFLYASLPEKGNGRIAEADSLLVDIHTYYGQTATIPRNEDESLDWSFEGPASDQEWAWGLNRHFHIRVLLQAYQQTGNEEYVRMIDQNIRDWILSSWPYPAVKSRTAMWRGLEVSFRVKTWASVFYALLDEELFNEATRILILTSIAEHCHYLKNFHAGTNWLTMEMSALLMAGVAWPEYSDASEWVDYSRDTMTSSLAEQVYPDGVQTELTAHYHNVALRNFELFYQTCQSAGVTLPNDFVEQLEKMWNYQAYSLRPSNTNPLNNDSDLRNYEDQITAAAERYQRDDWTYIITNTAIGEKPESTSIIFPYAGQVILRSGYERDASWLFFDIGPWGSGHQHNDKLHVSFSVQGKDFLVDSGRFAYRGTMADKFRSYGKSSAGHNVLLIDGQGQLPGPKLSTEPISDLNYQLNATYQYASGAMTRYENVEGEVRHERAVVMLEDMYLVLDHLMTDSPRDIKTLWHWHPDCTVKETDQSVIATNDGAALQLLPVADHQWNLTMIEGQETPEKQGWYSREYNEAEPNSTSIFQTSVDSTISFIWLLVPGTEQVEAQITDTAVDGIGMEITRNEDRYTLFIPFQKASLLDVNIN